MKKYILITAIILGLVSVLNAETMPPKPDKYFNDYAGIVSAEQAHAFNEILAQFERDTSNQFVIAIYPNMDSDSSVEDYTHRIAQSWQVGQKDKNNGLVLFVFMKTPSGHGRIQAATGYGLEGPVPDATCFDITERVMKPYFKQKDFYGGLNAGIDQFMKAAKGEYKGTGETVAETIDLGPALAAIGHFLIWAIGILFILSLFIIIYLVKRHQRMKAQKAEQARQDAIRNEQWRKQQAEQERLYAIAEAKKQREWQEYLKNETPAQRKARLEKEAAAAAAAALAQEEARKRRAKQNEENEEERRRRSSYSSSSESSSSYGGGSSDSGFSSGGGSFGGGGGGSDF